MEPTTEIQATEDLTLSGDYAAASADSLVVDNANDNAGQEGGFEIVLKDDETAPKQDPAKNAEFARRRIERKRQRELEQQMEAVKRGELPESLRVNPDLPPQPDINAYLSEEGLAKYDYDNSRALAAFNAANTEWLMKAQDARSNAVAEQGRKTQEFTSNQRNTSKLPANTMTRRKSSISLTIRRKKTHLCNWFRLRLGPTLCACSRRSPPRSCITWVQTRRKPASYWRWMGSPR